MNEKKEENFIQSRKACELTGLTDQTLRKYADEGKIRSYRTPSGHRMYSKSSLQKLINYVYDVQIKENKKKIIYCRVSSKNQLDDLARQSHSLQSQFPNHELVTDCGSGLNFTRKGLKTILEQTMHGNVQEIVVAHKDRLCRFAYELIEFICSSNGCKIIILDQEKFKSKEQELAEDIMSIITVFSCRKYGSRKYNCDKKDKTIS